MKAPVAPPAIEELVERFERGIADYCSPSYKEAELRKAFIDPLLEQLGWDVSNRQGFAEAYKEVVNEDAIKIGGTTKAPDYGICIGGVRKFYIEVKKPSEDILASDEHALQLRRYGWNKKLPLSILTNFRDFVVYDTRIRPKVGDSPSVARIRQISFKDFVRRWDLLYGTFSKEAVLKGSFDKYAETNKDKKGTTEVDEAFLEEIEAWRETLAKNLALRNPTLSQDELNYAVQVTIDRIVFLRICEDRGLETYGRLRSLLDGGNTYSRLKEYYRLADERYNSGLFHFDVEKGRGGIPDELTPRLSIDDKVLKDVIKTLYYPHSPYEFSVLPPEILGQVYEQFLGKVIRLTTNHRAQVEDKPEVKKAGGVYYTPTYVVDYIIRMCLDTQLRDKTPDDVSTFRVLDPACGSGSFLLGAYQYLLDWHRDYYVRHNPKKFRDRIHPGPGGTWVLSQEEKKRILLNNIFGVDVDAQAVEVTKLSLLLKVLEQSSKDAIDRNQKITHRRALPDLGSNIKCGNSIISPAFYTSDVGSQLDDNERARVNAFDWQLEFASVMRDGGFDAVIGNPPYVNAWELYANTPALRDYLNQDPSFATAERHWDLYILFIERGLQLCRQGGRLAYIIPYSYAIQKYARASRELLLNNFTLESVTDYRKVRVFGKVPVITIIPVVKKAKAPPNHLVQVVRAMPPIAPTTVPALRRSHKINQSFFRSQKESALRLDITPEAAELLRRVQERSRFIGDICYVNYGAQMSSKEKGKFGKDHVIRNGRESETCKPMISGRELYRYQIRWEGRYVEWALAGEMYGPRWTDFFEKPKIMVRDLTGTHRIEVTLDDRRFYCDHTILCVQRWADVAGTKKVAAGLVEQSSQYPLTYITGFLGSKLISAFNYLALTGEGVRTGGGFHTYPESVRQLPIFPVDNASPEIVQKVGHLVTRALELGIRVTGATVPQQRLSAERELQAIDSEIDALVYDLYGLSESERTLVEAVVGGE